ncbi:hypothetical protein F5Y11DRAFT_366796 [Daldinia sp. FL1419]|nr:hypothetical protein F5Y11DRAFT_366796 [Daldinia sp. FL1419]
MYCRRYTRYVTFPSGRGFTLTTLWEEFKTAILQDKSVRDLRANWAPIRLGCYASEYRHFDISPATLRNVVGVCRTHGTTLTGLLQALAHASLACRVSSDQAPGFIGSTIVNLRPIMKQALKKKVKIDIRDMDLTRAMANFMTTVDHVFDKGWVTKIRTTSVSNPSREELRDSAENHGEVENENRDGGSDSRVIDGKADSSSIAVETTSRATKAPAPAGEASVWSIGRSIFSVSSEVHGAALGICAVATKDGELYVSYDWQESTVSTTIGEGLTVDLESWLNFIGREKTQ